MTKDTIVAAGLDLIAAKAKILAEQYRNNQLWDGELDRELNEIATEITAIQRNSSSAQRWATTSDGSQWNDGGATMGGTNPWDK